MEFQPGAKEIERGCLKFMIAIRVFIGLFVILALGACTTLP